MQCTWPKLARLSCRFARPSSNYCGPVESVCSIGSLLNQRRRLHIALQPTKNTQFDGAESHVPSDPPVRDVGRTVAQAVRLSAQQGDFGNASLIVQSLYHAHSPGSYAQHLSFLGKPNGELILFNKSVSPRLPAYALLHAFIRTGKILQASKLIEAMVSMGTRVRRSSLQAALGEFEKRASASLPTTFTPSYPFNSLNITSLQPHIVHNAHLTGGALKILEAARRSKGGSTGRMYRYLIAMCIINGEIILASLLFGMLLRDWQAREKAKAAAAATAASLLQPLSTESLTKAPMPKYQELKDMCNFITYNLGRPHVNSTAARNLFTASLQSLTNIATDMDQRRMSVNLVPVITSIYSCPRTSEMVWVSQDGIPPKRVAAYPYLHDVLDRLIQSLPERELEQAHLRSISDPPKYNIPQPLPPVNPLTYNALLHYTLRHQRSIDNARFVLVHLLKHLESSPPDRKLRTQDAMMNILDRAVKDFPPGEVEALMKEVGLAPVSLKDLLTVSRQHAIDVHAISSRITTLISKGETQTVIDALPILLPGLFPPAVEQGTPTFVAAKQADQWREAGLERATLLGPVVFTSLLNALRKAGRTGLAESVFVYGLEAEKKSFDLNVNPKEPKPNSHLREILIRPWCLPVHAYTTMIQVYNNERTQTHSKYSYAKGWGLTPEWSTTPYHLNSKSVNVERNVLGREMILQIYRLMMEASHALMSRLKKLEEHAKAAMETSADSTKTPRLDIKIVMGRGGRDEFLLPEPDVWFFESLLDMFMKTPEDPLFPGVVREMRKRGFAVNVRALTSIMQTWGPAVLQEVPASWENVSERNRKPVRQTADLLARSRLNAPARIGWKRWAPKDRITHCKIDLGGISTERSERLTQKVNHDDVLDAMVDYHFADLVPELSQTK